MGLPILTVQEYLTKTRAVVGMFSAVLGDCGEVAVICLFQKHPCVKPLNSAFWRSVPVLWNVSAKLSADSSAHDLTEVVGRFVAHRAVVTDKKASSPSLFMFSVRPKPF